MFEIDLNTKDLKTNNKASETSVHEYILEYNETKEKLINLESSCIIANESLNYEAKILTIDIDVGEENIFRSVYEFIKKIVNKLIDMIKSVYNTIVSLFKKIIDYLKKIFKDDKKGGGGSVRERVEEGKKKVDNIIAEHIRNPDSDIVVDILPYKDQIKTLVKNGLKTIPTMFILKEYKDLDTVSMKNITDYMELVFNALSTNIKNLDLEIEKQRHIVKLLLGLKQGKTINILNDYLNAIEFGIIYDKPHAENVHTTQLDKIKEIIRVINSFKKFIMEWYAKESMSILTEKIDENILAKIYKVTKKQDKDKIRILGITKETIIIEKKTYNAKVIDDVLVKFDTLINDIISNNDADVLLIIEKLIENYITVTKSFDYDIQILSIYDIIDRSYIENKIEKITIKENTSISIDDTFKKYVNIYSNFQELLVKELEDLNVNIKRIEEQNDSLIKNVILPYKARVNEILSKIENEDLKKVSNLLSSLTIAVKDVVYKDINVLQKVKTIVIETIKIINEEQTSVFDVSDDETKKISSNMVSLLNLIFYMVIYERLETINN